MNRGDMENSKLAGHSAPERRISRVIVPAPDGYPPNLRINWIHDPDLALRRDHE